MLDPTFHVELERPRRVIVRLLGSLDRTDVDALADALLPRVRKLGPGVELIYDLLALESCTTAARERLVEVQADIARCKARTSFVADRPRFRGIGLFIAHTSGDPNARAFHSMTQAETWLSVREGRIESITTSLGRRRRGRNKQALRRSSDEFFRRLAESQGDKESKP